MYLLRINHRLYDLFRLNCTEPPSKKKKKGQKTNRATEKKQKINGMNNSNRKTSSTVLCVFHMLCVYLLIDRVTVLNMDQDSEAYICIESIIKFQFSTIFANTHAGL